MLIQILILMISISLIVFWALWATKYATKFSENFHVSKFVIGLIIVSVISILPETLIAINSVLEWAPELWLWTLFGSNVVDLTLAFGIIILFSWRKNLKIEAKVLKTDTFYPYFILLPIILWLDGHYGRLEWVVLIIVGIFFYYMAFKNGVNEAPEIRPKGKRWVNVCCLLWSIAVLLIGSHFAVNAGIEIARILEINPILIGMFVIGLGTIIPETVFAFHAVKKHEDSLAVWDLLWTVLADATIVVGILALISDFYFPQKVVYITGWFMLIAAIVLSYFMHTGKKLSKREWIALILLWMIFLLTEYFINT